VFDVKNGFANFDNCLSKCRCKVGETVQYTCATGFAISSPTTTCQADHTWSVMPSCIEGPVTTYNHLKNVKALRKHSLHGEKSGFNKAVHQW